MEGEIGKEGGQVVINRMRNSLLMHVCSIMQRDVLSDVVDVLYMVSICRYCNFLLSGLCFLLTMYSIFQASSWKHCTVILIGITLSMENGISPKFC